MSTAPSLPTHLHENPFEIAQSQLRRVGETFAVDPNLIEMATSFGATEREIWTKILLPGALPAIMTGIRLGLGRGVTGMVIVELLMVAVGIGNLILRFQGNFSADLLYAVVDPRVRLS